MYIIGMVTKRKHDSHNGDTRLYSLQQRVIISTALTMVHVFVLGQIYKNEANYLFKHAKNLANVECHLRRSVLMQQSVGEISCSVVKC